MKFKLGIPSLWALIAVILAIYCAYLANFVAYFSNITRRVIRALNHYYSFLDN